MPVEVSVIVVTWNARAFVDECLSAVLGTGGAGVDLELLVVDNGSTDGTLERVREHWVAEDPRVQLLESGRNGGMAFGNNLGMLHARGRAFLLLNADAFLEPGALRTMLERLDARMADGDVAAVAPALLNTDGSPQRSVRGFPTPWRYATEFLYLRRLAPRSRTLNAFYGGGLDLAREQFVEWATGACVLVPRSSVDAVGLMDESYVMYGEEVDWFARMHAVGRRVLWVPDARVVHVGGGSARTEWNRWYGVQLANHVRYTARNVSVRAAVRTRWVVLWSLRLRAGLYRVAGALPLPGSGARRARAGAFARGAAAVREVDPRAIPERIIPAWPAG